MAIFGRRVVQQALDKIAGLVMSPVQRNDVVRRLNKPTRQAIAAEWEVVLLAALSCAADVEYERCFNGVRLDILAKAGTGDNRVEFVADIVTISDVEADKRNPVDFLFSEFHRISHKYGCGTGGFDIRVGDQQVGTYPDKRTELLLPKKGDIPAFLAAELTPFLHDVRSRPQSPHVWEYRRAGIDIRISYDPKRLGGVTGGYACAASPLSLRRNPLFAALDAKATKLRQSGWPGPRGVFVTDGDCRALAATGGGLGAWSRDQIVERFLADHPAVHFVTTTTYENRSGWGHRQQGLYNKIYWQRPFDDALTAKLYPVINHMFRELPPVIEAPNNAWRDVRNRRQLGRGCKLGAYNWTPNQKLAISSRTFLGLVAQTLSNRDFQLLFDRTIPPDGGPMVHFFANVAALKTRVTSVHVEICQDEDDDWITFDCMRSERASSAPDPRAKTSVDIAMFDVIQYFANLDHRLSAGGKLYSTAEMPTEAVSQVRSNVEEGRMLLAAELTNTDALRLFFGDRDSAVAHYV